jgi:hypothetical protein
VTVASRRCPTHLLWTSHAMLDFHCGRQWQCDSFGGYLRRVPGGSHPPHQPKKEWIEKFKGKFDMGWEKRRDEIFANQKRLGVIPAKAKLTPWPDDLPKWDSLSDMQKKLYARQAEVFAGYTAYTDDEIGRVIQAVQDRGQLYNTLIIYIDGDNGASPEGSLSGTYNQMTVYNGVMHVPMPLQLLHYDDWGSDKTYAHMAVGGHHCPLQSEFVGQFQFLSELVLLIDRGCATFFFFVVEHLPPVFRDLSWVFPAMSIATQPTRSGSCRQTECRCRC